MKRLAAVAAALALLLGSAGQAKADLITLDASGRGWFSPQQGNNGNDLANNYIAGAGAIPAQYRNHFDFLIPVLSGALTSATLTLDNVGEGHAGGTHTYTVFSLGTFGTYGYSDISAGTPYGSVDISASGVVTISLDAAALAAIEADQGGTFSLGGVDSGETAFPKLERDFGFTDFTSSTTLTLNTAAVPEPASLTMLGLSALGFAGYAWRRRKMAVA